MKKIEIYEFQLKTIIDALGITARIHKSNKGETCFDRQVTQAYKYAKNALEEKIDERVPYISRTKPDKDILYTQDINGTKFTYRLINRDEDPFLFVENVETNHRQLISEKDLKRI